MTTHDHDALDGQTGLHQRVIQQLTRVAFELSAASNLAGDGVAERIESVVDVLDEVIKDLRRATFEAAADRRQTGNGSPDGAESATGSDSRH
ncbi:hypothetical protein [Microlunatus parietis]|uniref:Uncharacterized protein n=1 Tax=Microlunatus parietis TaxID=682979 RepID=A0A7Y9LDI2_9ACTN|nr:hypothetical protein [Microlunatus parietis]NYE73922.1 hypothetical protein [Microlunatus parietis]